jgi:hypothetical protein
MKLEVGDVILTGNSWIKKKVMASLLISIFFLGTPAGVGPIKAGDIVTAGLRPEDHEKELVEIKFDVIDRMGGFVHTKK